MIQGLSPPTRGTPKHTTWIVGGIGSIPAHAGNPGPPPGRLMASGGLSPPTRGTPLGVVTDELICQGLSPPTRGTPSPRASRHRGRGSIPAHAGNPPFGEAGDCATRVYPRPRGEPPRSGASGPAHQGLSPPTRGTPNSTSCRASGTGSIPAHAGNPSDSMSHGDLKGVYPRPRGEPGPWIRDTTRVMGLSPPTRGTPPACAS